MRKQQKEHLQKTLEEINKSKNKEEKLQEIIKRETRTWIILLDNAIWVIAIILMITILIQGGTSQVITTDVLYVETCNGSQTGYIEATDGIIGIKGNYEWTIKNNSENNKENG